MLKTIRKKIFRPLFWTSAALVAVLGVTAVLVTAGLTFSQFRSLALGNLRREGELMASKLDGVFERVGSLATEEVAEALASKRPLPEDTVSRLDTGRIMTDGLACYLYSADALRAYSSNVFEPVEFTSLKEDPQLAAFFSDDAADECLSVRDTALSGSFASSLYNPREGIVSCFVKIRLDGAVVGCAAADLSPAFVYDSFASRSFIRAGGGLFLREGSDEYAGYFDFASTELSPSRDRKYLVRRDRLGGGAELAHFVSMASYNRGLAVTASIIAGAVAAGCAAAYLASRLLSGWIYNALNRIKSKIDGTVDA